MTDVFAEVRERVTAKEAAIRYGLEVKRDFARCPFHSERTGSLHFFDGQFYCFGCHEKGSSIDFTARLFGLDAVEAVRRLNEDFSLGLELDRPATVADKEAARKRKEAQEVKEQFEKWRCSFINQLNACIRHANRLTISDLDSLTEADILALQYKEAFEEWAGQLAADSMEGRIEIFRMKGGIEPLVRKILNPILES